MRFSGRRSGDRQSTGLAGRSGFSGAAETAVAARRVDDLAVPFAFGDDRLRIVGVTHEDQHTDVVRAPVRLMLSLREDGQSLPLALQSIGRDRTVWLLSGPEGGLTAAEEALAMNQGWTPVSLGPFTLRAETAPVAALVAMGICRAAM